ncbi:contractile injection system protein, VgrG/Pvc8 family [Tepidicaulis sp. LMO-SS28]|uniref:contractile injection system protein, VgrG/Pvc8 family n=1 Tax=Tepidicaulis sp. LMO-SS28 TaxID=3447455 RepID=UPI003EE18E46
MRPEFKIVANGTDITPLIADRLISLSLTDERGEKSDAAVIEIDNRELRVAVPPKGATLEIWLGYRERGMARLGVFTCDEVEIGGPPDTLTIEGKAADMGKTLKQPKTRSWEAMTLGGIVSTIAGEHGLAPKTAEALAATAYDHLDQTDESDLHFLTRLARDLDAVAKPANRHLLFVPRGETKAASGALLTAVTVTPEDLAGNWRARFADRGKYTAVKAYWHDVEGAERRQVVAGSGTPVFTIRNPFSSAAEAKAAAKAKLGSLARGTAVFEGEFLGRPEFAAEAPLEVQGFGAAADGSWVLTRVTHSLRDGAGYRCSIEAEMKG